MRRLILLTAVGLAFAAAGVVAYGVLGPDPERQAQADGCGRSRFGAFNRLEPQWAYVGDKDVAASSPSPPPQWLAGIVQAFENGPDAVHPSGVDDPTTHDAYDVNFNVLPDAGYEQLLGGLAEADTGNFSGEDEERDRIHPEREQTALPAWAWPEAGDHVKVMGSWVWDCGHWDPGGERTEIHPYRALWDERVPSPRSPYGESEGSLYVSTDATPAGIAAECAHRTKKDGQAFKTCTRTQPNWLDVTGDYELTLNAPPKPQGAARLRIRVVDRGSTVDPHWAATIANGKLTLRFHLESHANERLVLAKQVYLGWGRVPARSLPLHLRVTFTHLLVRRAMDPGCPNAQRGCGTPQTVRDDQITTAPGEWIVYTDVAGAWMEWPLLRAKDGGSYAFSRATDVYVRPAQAWRLFVFPRECDFGNVSWSDPAKPLAPCPPSKEFGNFSGDDVPGEVVARYRGANGLGSHAVDASLAHPSTCPQANRRGCYRLSWTIARVRDEQARASRLRR